MKIIEPSFTLNTPWSDSLTREDGIKMLRFIERKARISHRSETRQTETSWEGFLAAVVLQHGDWSVTEHAAITVDIRTDRGITHEIVRHRLFSFTQESTRFVRYKDELEFILPLGMEPFETSNFDIWKQSVEAAERDYKLLIGRDAKPQQARSILPNSLAATIAVTGNLRNWRHFFLMRTSKETHPDFRRISIPMLAEFQKVVPLLYSDITPEQSQRVNLEKAR
jgi:thymidylate synthase (FAD)